MKLWAIPFWFCPFLVFTQIQLTTPSNLTTNLYELIENHKVDISFNQKLTDSVKTTVNSNYSNVNEALIDLLSDSQIRFKKINNSYIIIKKKLSREVSLYHFKGQLYDGKTNEPLPYSVIQFENGGSQCDENGNFRFYNIQESIKVNISHTGFYKLDTVLKSGQTHKISLKPAISELESITVSSKRIELLSSGLTPGQLTINHQLANFLPGNRNNTIFNLLRLQPGIMASGETSDDFVIRGSYKGQNQILFDDITIFNPSSLRDNIGEFNPMIIRELSVYKSGYQVEIGDRVNGVIDIKAKNGDSSKFHFDANLSNQAFGNYYNIPLKNHGAIQIAYRIAYNDIFSPSTFKPNEKVKNSFLFGDINLKYHGYLKNNDQIRVTILGNGNNQELTNSDKVENNISYNNFNTTRYQSGGNFSYFKNWKKGALTKFGLSYSIANNRLNNDSKIVDSNNIATLSSNKIMNTIQQATFQINHRFHLKNQELQTGFNYTFNQSNFSSENKLGINSKNIQTIGHRFTVYFKNKIDITKYFELEPGIKIDMITTSIFPYWQPRLRMKIKPDKHWSINLSYGLYNQFITENPIIDENENTYYTWNIADENNKLRSHHYVGGLTFKNKWMSGSIEGYYINTRNLNRVYQNSFGIINTEIGSTESYGIDLNLKFKIRRHLLWGTYSIRKTTESFVSKDNITNTGLAPQDQRHEFKLASVLKFHPFYLSTNYVFGSGIQNGPQYHRLDIAGMYRYTKKKLKFETGISILNLTNHKNERLNNFASFNEKEISAKRGIPITPNVFFRVFL